MSNRPYKNVKRFADGISKDIKKEMRNNTSLSIVKLSGDTDVLGKLVSELMNSFKTVEDEIVADLPYVEGYTGFSGDPEEQEGNYLVFRVDTKLEGATIKVKTAKGTYTLDEDRIMVLLIKNGKGSITVTAKTDTETLSRTYKLNLKLEEKE